MAVFSWLAICSFNNVRERVYATEAMMDNGIMANAMSARIIVRVRRPENLGWSF
jgi:hypothetical protein